MRNGARRLSPGHRCLSRSFVGVHALQGVTLELRRGEVVGLIGPNGAGKTTLVNVMTGFDLPSSGSVELEDRDITGWRPHRRGRAGLARTFQHSHSFGNLSVRGERRGIRSGSRRCSPRCSSPGDAAPRPPRYRSVRRRSCICTSARRGTEARGRPCARHRAALRAHGRASSRPSRDRNPRVCNVLRSVRDERGVGVLLIDHNMALVMEVCDRIHVLDQGKTLAEVLPRPCAQTWTSPLRTWARVRCART